MEVTSETVETPCSLTQSHTQAGPVKIAALDFDGTIIDGQSGVELVKFMIGKKLLNPLAIAKIAWWGVRYKLHLPCEQAEVREDIFDMFTDDKVSDVVDMMKQFHDDVLVPLYRKDAIATIEQLKRDGYYVIMVTASFLSCVMPAAERLGMDALLATRMELTEDKTGYTGKVEGIPVEGLEKVEALIRFGNKKFGKGNFVVERAYGDHYSDKYMLNYATQAYVVTPDSKLERLAKSKEWPILQWS